MKANQDNETGEGKAPRATKWIQEMAQNVTNQSPSNDDLREFGKVLIAIADDANEGDQ